MSNKKHNSDSASLMVVWCYRCKNPFDSKEGPINSISHGLCPKCFTEEMRLVKEKYNIKDSEGQNEDKI